MGDNRKRSSSAAIDVVDLLSSDSDSDSECKIVPPPTKPTAAAGTSFLQKKKKAKVNNPYKTKKSKTLSAKGSEDSTTPRATSSTFGSNSNKKSTTKTTTTSAGASSKNSASSGGGGAKGHTTTFRVATYNVWFGPSRQVEPPHQQQERMRHLVRALLQQNKQSDAPPLWFVGFQEVTPFLYQTLEPLLTAAGYVVFCQDHLLLNMMGGYGCMMAVLHNGAGPEIVEQGWKPFSNTIMMRGFLYVRARLPNSQQQVLFTTTHLESYAGQVGPGGQTYTGAKEREQQLPEMETFCLQQQQSQQDLALSIMTGDLNWDDERPQSVGPNQPLLQVLSSKDWQDSWLNIQQKQLERLQAASRNGKVAKKNIPTCYTYDTKENPMLGGSMRRRFDRIVFRPKDNSSTPVKVRGVDLIGKEPIPGLIWTKKSEWQGRVTSVKDVPVTPSDHWGVVVTMQIGNNP